MAVLALIASRSIKSIDKAIRAFLLYLDVHHQYSRLAKDGRSLGDFTKQIALERNRIDMTVTLDEELADTQLKFLYIFNFVDLLNKTRQLDGTCSRNAHSFQMIGNILEEPCPFIVVDVATARKNCQIGTNEVLGCLWPGLSFKLL